MTKHTPGPWAVSDERSIDIIIRNSERDPVASVYSAGWPKPTARANAALIARAPDMAAEIDALKVEQGDLLARVNRLAHELDTSRTVRDKLKAERDELLVLVQEIYEWDEGVPYPDDLYKQIMAAIAKVEKED